MAAEMSVPSVWEWRQYFPDRPGLDPQRLQITRVGKYSITRPEHAAMVSEAIKAFTLLVTQSPAVSIVDATACVGGNTLSFLDYFQLVTAIELSSVHFYILRQNLNAYGFDEGCGRLRLVNADFTQVLFTLCSDVVFLDPPWNNSGPLPEIWHDRKRDLMLYLSDTPIYSIISEILQTGRARVVALKAPSNVNLNLLMRRLPFGIMTQIVKIHTYYLILFGQPLQAT
jgi:16S rRNA G966 N2-methylase RsmD